MFVTFLFSFNIFSGLLSGWHFGLILVDFGCQMGSCVEPIFADFADLGASQKWSRKKGACSLRVGGVSGCRGRCKICKTSEKFYHALLPLRGCGEFSGFAHAADPFSRCFYPCLFPQKVQKSLNRCPCEAQCPPRSLADCNLGAILAPRVQQKRILMRWARTIWEPIWHSK